MSQLSSSGIDGNARDTHHVEPMLLHGDEGPIHLTLEERRELTHQETLNEYLEKRLKGVQQ